MFKFIGNSQCSHIYHAVNGNADFVVVGDTDNATDRSELVDQDQVRQL